MIKSHLVGLEQIANNDKFVSSLIGWNSTEGDYRMCNTTWGHLMILLKGYLEKDRVDPFTKSICIFLPSNTFS
jgi:ketosteroid isomerase-like protein